MTKVYGPYSTGAGAVFAEAQWQTLFSALPTGVLTGMGTFADSTGMQVKVPAGIAVLQGFIFQDDAQETISIGTSNPSNPRIDRLVMRRDMGAKTTDYFIKPGIAATSPVPPALQRDSSIWEVSLAAITVPANAATIAPGNVADERYSPDVCGIISPSLVGVVECLSTSRPTITLAPLGAGVPNGTLIMEMDTGAMRYWYGGAWSGALQVGGVQTSPHLTSPTIDSGPLNITAGGININSANQSIVSAGGGYLVIQSGGDLYLRSNVGGTVHIDQGPTSFGSQNVSGIGTLTMNGALSMNGVLSGVTSMLVSPGDITVARGNTTGYIFLGNAGFHYLGYDGTQYVLNAGNLFVNGSITMNAGSNVAGDPIVTAAATQVLGNKSFANNVTINGPLVVTGSATLGGNSVVNGGLTTTGSVAVTGNSIYAMFGKAQDSTANSFGILLVGGDNRQLMYCRADGAFNFSSVAWTLGSSRAIKDDVQPILNGIARLRQLQPVHYVRTDHDAPHREFGLIAEDVADVMPEIVGFEHDGRATGIRYDNLIAPLIAAIQQLDTRLELIENRKVA